MEKCVGRVFPLDEAMGWVGGCTPAAAGLVCWAGAQSGSYDLAGAALAKLAGLAVPGRRVQRLVNPSNDRSKAVSSSDKRLMQRERCNASTGRPPVSFPSTTSRRLHGRRCGMDMADGAGPIQGCCRDRRFFFMPPNILARCAILLNQTKRRHKPYLDCADA